MDSQTLRSIRARTESGESFLPTWLWTWSGICFGYRRGDSLFTYDGFEVGRFVGAEVYGPDGKYLGELRADEIGDRLITSSYKKSLTSVAFMPTFERGQKRPDDRVGQEYYCGYEEFPLPEIVKETMLERRNLVRSFTNGNHIQ